MWPPETHRLVRLHLLSVSPEEGRGTLCGHLLVARRRLWLVWGSREERESMALNPRASSSFTVRGIWEMQQGSMGLVLTLWGGMEGGSIPEDKLDVIALKSSYSGD